MIIKHQTFPVAIPRPGEPGYDPEYRIACTKVLGESRGRVKAFRPASVVNVSGMSFGSLSGQAVEALNRGAVVAGCLHNTGEGGVRPITSAVVVSCGRSARVILAAASSMDGSA